MKITSYTVTPTGFQVYFDHYGYYESWAQLDHNGIMLDSMFYPETRHAARQTALIARALQRGFIGYRDMEG
jgi:ABC-type Zn2+ transport system substrate-binding protein/surface adhesin